MVKVPPEMWSGVDLVGAYFFYVLAELAPDSTQILSDPRCGSRARSEPCSASTAMPMLTSAQALDSLSIEARVHVRELPQSEGARFGQQFIVAGRETPFAFVLVFQFFPQG